MQKLPDDDNSNAMKSTPESIIKFGWDENIRSIQDDEVFDMCVGSLIICCKANCAALFLISFPLWLDLSREYQFFDLAFKSSINAIRNGLFWHKVSKLYSRLLINF